MNPTTLHLTMEQTRPTSTLLQESQTLPRPPKNFIPAEDVVEAQFAERPPSFIRQGRASGKKAAGIRYERKVHEILMERWDTYVPGLWHIEIAATDPSVLRYCQPDGFLLDLAKGHITIIEIKLKHTPMARDRDWET